MNPVRGYQTRDRSRVEAICRSAFRLTSFHTDPSFPRDAAETAVWDLYARPALERGTPPCLVAEDDGQVSGFLVYGGYGVLSRELGQRMANIVLVAVDPSLQGKGIGKALVTSVMERFRNRGTGLVTVGTDAGNVPALRTYDRTGFVPVLDWTTWRRWDLCPSYSGIPAEPVYVPCGPGLLVLSSLLEDPRLADPAQRIIRHHIDQRRPFDALAFRQEGSVCVFERQSRLSELCRTPFYRLSSIHGSVSTDAVSAGIASLPHPREKICVEVFMKTGQTGGEETLRRAGFRPVHRAVALHAHLY